MKEIRHKNTPEINDDLAKSVGHEHLEALKDSVRAELDEVVKQENEARAQRMVVEAVAHTATVDIPETMVERERDLNSFRWRFRDLKVRLAKREGEKEKEREREREKGREL